MEPESTTHPGGRVVVQDGRQQREDEGEAEQVQQQEDKDHPDDP